MNHSNYTLFEIIKYKIEFLECLEYSLISNETTENEISKHISYLNNEFKEGLYNKIISTLFTSFNLLNKPISNFLKKYNHNKIEKMIKSNKLKLFINYNESIIDCYETFNYIINVFTEEEQIVNILDKKILDLISINKNHFINFLFFNTYNTYINSLYNKEKTIKHTKKDIQRLQKIMNYCNIEKKFDHSIKILKENNENEIYKELENLSNKCIKSEKEQYDCLTSVVDIINKEIKKEKN